MEQVVTHDWAEETLEAKAQWFQALTLRERMELLCDYYEFFLSVNPRIIDRKDAQPIEGRVLVLSKA
ncbi:MAG: hypothetical protein KJ046_06615 [Anaerolineae bacterium]|nr:hypothetical protein [Anaerolineae bacterium]